MIFAAVSDVHSPRYLESFIDSLRPRKVDAVLFAGDMVEKGAPSAFQEVYKRVHEAFNAPIICCMGNSEWFTCRDAVKRRFPQAVWLDSEGVVLESDGGDTCAVYGSLGVLGRPTKWQLKTHPNIVKVYQENLSGIRDYFNNVQADRKLLLTHYATTHQTLVGEDQSYWDELGCDLTGFLVHCGVDVSIHGHAHRSKVNCAQIGGTRVYNVAFPVTSGCTYIEL